MKKVVSFLFFATIVILSLIAKNTAEAQTVRPMAFRQPVLVKPMVVGPCHRRVHARMGVMPRHFIRRNSLRQYGRPVRARRYSW